MKFNKLELEGKIMTEVISIRPAKVFLSWGFDPSGHLRHLSNDFIAEVAGVIPDLFERAISEAKGIDAVATAMDGLYGHGGFMHDFGGSVSSDDSHFKDAMYVSSYEEDDDLPPFLSLKSIDPSEKIECLIYNHGITALRDGEGNFKVGRFD